MGAVLGYFGRWRLCFLVARSFLRSHDIGYHSGIHAPWRAILVSVIRFVKDICFLFCLTRAWGCMRRRPGLPILFLA